MAKNRNPLDGQTWPIGVALLGMAVAALWYWGWNITPLGYDKVYFLPTKAKAGEEIKLCFQGARWYHLCPTELQWNVTCDIGEDIPRRLDFPPYHVNVPAQTGLVAPKCRDFVVPKACHPGRMIYSATARSVCVPFGEWNPRYVAAPQAELEVLPSQP